MACVALLWIAFAAATAQAQTLLSETTWGGDGSDVSEGVATAADGTSYLVGITDSFARDPFGNPSPRIFLVKFAPDGIARLAKNLERDNRQGAWANRRRARRR